MSPNLNLVWVNKTRDSSSLSNCRNQKDTFRQIRSQAVTVGHESSCVKRPIKRTPLDLYGTRRYVPLRPNDDLWLHSRAKNAEITIHLRGLKFRNPRVAVASSIFKDRQALLQSEAKVTTLETYLRSILLAASQIYFHLTQLTLIRQPWAASGISKISGLKAHSGSPAA
jgi:hypothetical protein